MEPARLSLSASTSALKHSADHPIKVLTNNGRAILTVPGRRSVILVAKSGTVQNEPDRGNRSSSHRRQQCSSRRLLLVELVRRLVRTIRQRIAMLALRS
jgi:hypothetical protein